MNKYHVLYLCDRVVLSYITIITIITNAIHFSILSLLSLVITDARLF